MRRNVRPTSAARAQPNGIATTDVFISRAGSGARRVDALQRDAEVQREIGLHVIVRQATADGRQGLEVHLHQRRRRSAGKKRRRADGTAERYRGGRLLDVALLVRGPEGV